MVSVIVLAALGAFLVNLALTWGILKFATKREIFDQPNHRTVHKAPVPRLGGVGIFWSSFLVLGFLLTAEFLTPFSVPGLSALALVILAFGILNVAGLYDDLKNIRAVTKFVWQAASALVVIGSGLYLKTLQIPFSDWVLPLGPVGPVLTFFWIVGVSNAINLIDGMDGLAGGISTLGIAAYGAYFLLTGQWVEALLAFVFVGALLGFLWYNQPPAKTFMGDSGSILLGAILAVLPLMGGEKSPFEVSWFLPITIVLIPVADTLGAIWRRLRDGRPIFSPDKEHMHHKLLHLGLSVRKILVVVYAVQIVLVSPLLLAVLTPGDAGALVKFWVPMVSVVVLASFFTILHFIFRARVSQEKKES